MIRSCEICGIEFPVKPSDIARGKGRFCSREHFHASLHASRHDPVIIAERFWAQVTKTPTCWLWTGVITTKGYGQINIKGKMVAAHRFAYTLTHGPIPEHLCVCHHCDNPVCVNPNHLFLGTQSDNMRDMLAKGRSLKGERHTMAKLTAAEVEEIRALHGKHTRREIAAMFGVTHHCIGKIHSRYNWKHL